MTTGVPRLLHYSPDLVAGVRVLGASVAGRLEAAGVGGRGGRPAGGGGQRQEKSAASRREQERRWSLERERHESRQGQPQAMGPRAASLRADMAEVLIGHRG